MPLCVGPGGVTAFSHVLVGVGGAADVVLEGTA